jgi:hypothetical protein
MSRAGLAESSLSVTPVLAAGVFAGVLAIIGAIAFVLWVLAHPPLPGLFSDSINYLQVAEYFAASFDGTVTDAHREQFAGTRFPPLYSLVLAAAGAGLQHWDQAINLSAFLVGTYVLLALAWLRQQTGTLALAFVLVPVAVLAPGIVEWMLLPLSEPLYAVIVLAALLAAGARSAPLLAAAALVALAPLCRSAGLALVIAFVAWLATDRDVVPARRVLGVVIAMLPAACWALYRATQPVLGGYAESLSIEATVHAAGGVGAFAVQQMQSLYTGATAWLDPGLPGAARVATVVLAMPVIVGLVLRLRDRKLDAWYLLVYLGVVAVWPYPNETARLLSVAAPMLALSAWTGVTFAIERLRLRVPRSAAQGYAALALCAIALAGSFGGYLRLLERTTADVPAELEPARRWTLYLETPDPTWANDSAETLVRAAYLIDDIPTAIPSGACVYTTFRAMVDMRAAYAFRTAETPSGLSADTAVATMMACDYVLVTQLGSPQRAQPPLYPLGLLGEHATVVLASEGERQGHGVLFAALVRIERGQTSDRPLQPATVAPGSAQ